MKASGEADGIRGADGVERDGGAVAARDRSLGPDAPEGPAASSTTFLVIVHARLAADGVPARDLPELAGRVADAFIDRDDAATVWIHLGTKPSRITLDVRAPDREAATARASGIVRAVTAGLAVACQVVAAAATTERERAALPESCPADDAPGPP